MNTDEQHNVKMQADEKLAHLIVFGNEKGGSGKSTSAMHVAIALLRLGYSVGTIDLDARQGTITRYMSNRWQYAASSDSDIPMPTHMSIEKSTADTTAAQEEQDREFLFMALGELAAQHDFIVIDTPGTYSYLSRLAHAQADTLVTPMNDSFIDLDLLAHFDQNSGELIRIAPYAKMVKEQLKETARWIVMRNRLSHLHDNNKLLVGSYLEKLTEELGFKMQSGFSERVIFKELFLSGLTLLDLKSGRDKALTMSEISARQEVRQLIHTIAPESAKGYAITKMEKEQPIDNHTNDEEQTTSDSKLDNSTDETLCSDDATVLDKDAEENNLDGNLTAKEKLDKGHTLDLDELTEILQQ